MEAITKPVIRVPSHLWTGSPFIFALLEFVVDFKLETPETNVHRSLTFATLKAHMARFDPLQTSTSFAFLYGTTRTCHASCPGNAVYLRHVCGATFQTTVD